MSPDSTIDDYWDGVDEQEAEIADRLHKERQEARAWDAYDQEEKP